MTLPPPSFPLTVTDLASYTDGRNLYCSRLVRRDEHQTQNIFMCQWSWSIPLEPRTVANEETCTRADKKKKKNDDDEKQVALLNL